MKLTKADDIERFINDHKFYVGGIKYSFHNNNSNVSNYYLLRYGYSNPSIFFDDIIIDVTAKIAKFGHTKMLYSVDREAIIKNIIN
jgi:hypothetical protein